MPPASVGDSEVVCHVAKHVHGEGREAGETYEIMEASSRRLRALTRFRALAPRNGVASATRTYSRSPGPGPACLRSHCRSEGSTANKKRT